VRNIVILGLFRDSVHFQDIGRPMKVRTMAMTLSSTAILLATGQGQTSAAQAEVPAEKTQPLKSQYTGIEYVRYGDRALKLDLFLPAGATSPAPTVVWIHGGGWYAGDKAACRSRFLVQHGFAAASVDYRLSGEALFPAAVEDCHAAICWLRANAEKYNLDPDRIGVWGSSAGGHLSALLGTSGATKNWSKSDISGEVQAVCDFSGPTDLARMADEDLKRRFGTLYDVTARFLGGPVEEKLEAAKAASPITYVHTKCPPFLIVHGAIDNVVSLDEATVLHDALVKLGVDSTLFSVKGVGHGVGGPEIDKAVLDFFNRTLKGKK